VGWPTKSLLDTLFSGLSSWKGIQTSIALIGIASTLRNALIDRSNSAVTDCTWSAASKLPLHEDQTVYAQLLHTIATTPPLRILPSKIPGASSGLFTTKDVEEGEEIFRLEPLVNYVMSGMERLVCDYCCKNHDSRIDPSGRFRTLTDHNLNMKACSGCRACYYCSRVSFVANLFMPEQQALIVLRPVRRGLRGATMSTNTWYFPNNLIYTPEPEYYTSY